MAEGPTGLSRRVHEGLQKMSAPAVVDHYGQCVDGLIAYFRSFITYFPHDWQVGRNDSKLNKGANQFLFFRPGSFVTAGPNPPSANSLVKDIDWQILGDLYSRLGDYENAWQKFEAFRAAIFWYVNTNPALAFFQRTQVPNVMAINMEAAGDPLPFESTVGFGSFIVQPLRFIVRQRITFPMFVQRSVP